MAGVHNYTGFVQCRYLLCCYRALCGFCVWRFVGLWWNKFIHCFAFVYRASIFWLYVKCCFDTAVCCNGFWWGVLFQGITGGIVCDNKFDTARNRREVWRVFFKYGTGYIQIITPHQFVLRQIVYGQTYKFICTKTQDPFVSEPLNYLVGCRIIVIIDLKRNSLRCTISEVILIIPKKRPVCTSVYVSQTYHYVYMYRNCMSHVAVTVNMCCKYRGDIDWRAVIYWCHWNISADNTGQNTNCICNQNSLFPLNSMCWIQIWP